MHEKWLGGVFLVGCLIWVLVPFGRGLSSPQLYLSQQNLTVLFEGMRTKKSFYTTH